MYFRIFFLFILYSSGSSHAQELKFEHLTSSQGLSHSTVYDIDQDREGFMWFGTREGLNRYDGYSIKTYYSNSHPGDSLNLLNNQVNCLLSSKRGLFIGTKGGLNLYDPEKDNFKNRFNGKRIDESITSLHETEEGWVLIGTVSNLYALDQDNRIQNIKKGGEVRGICNYEKDIFWVITDKDILLLRESGKIVKQYTLSPSPNLEDAGLRLTLNTLYKDKQGTVWIGTSKGLYNYNQLNDRFHFFSFGNGHNIEANVIRDIAEDDQGQLWIATESGLFIYNKHTGETTNYSYSLNPSTKLLSDKSIYSLFISDEGITWLGTYFGGVNYTIPKGKGFQKLTSSENSHSLSGKAISEIIEDRDHKLWIATEDGGISILDTQKNHFSYLNNRSGLSSNNVHSLYEDNQGSIWIGTFLGGLNRYRKETGEITSYMYKSGDTNSLSNNYVYSIMQDNEDRIWVGTQSGLNIYNPDDDSFELFKPELLAHTFIYDMIQDKRGDLWICTRFSGIYHYIPSEDRIEHFSTQNKGPKEITSDQIISVMEDSKDNLWFGTLTGGVLKWDTTQKAFTSYGEEDGLPNNNVYAVLEDKNKMLWLTTNKGLSKFDPRQNKFYNYDSQDGLSTNQFNFKSAFKTADEWLYFGSINGITYFHPDSLKEELPAPPIEFTNLKLFNKKVPITENGILKKRINLQDTIKVKYWQNVLTLEFAALNYQSSNKYAYYLDNFEESWNNVGDKNSVTYTNLSPGEYTFRVKTLPLSNSNERRVHLIVNPPFWRTDWAYFGYFILLLLLIYGYWRFVRFVHAQKLAVHMEKVERDRISAINQERLDFFTFISHEFKTPLTLIIASVGKIFQGNSSSKEYEDFGLIRKNAVRLHHLVQQLIEFRKIETTHEELHLSKGNVIVFLKDTFQAFSLLMEEKNIRYSCKADISDYFCYFDADKLEMIVTNLISNAIRYTSNHGEILFTIHISNHLDEKNRSQLQLKIEDTGKGMKENEIIKSFEPFYTSPQVTHKPNSTGIGLALTKSLIDFLEGSIEVTSKEKGLCVIVKIPLLLKIKNGLKKEITLIEGNQKLNINPDLFIENDLDDKAVENTSLPKDLSIMLVEDDVELSKLLQKHFLRKFKVMTAENGEEAWKKIKNRIPDIIISDIKMKQVDGINLCKKIKRDPETKHIPVIMLTGLTENTYRMESLRVGANAFINKPFNLSELDLLVKNSLETNQSVEHRFSGVPENTKKDFPKTNQNLEFLRKVNEVVITNFSDPNFNVEEFARKMDISRSLLHLKIKKLTGISASAYLKEVRMQRACELIEKGLSISEVAYSIGYSDPNYFSRAFKKEFKVSPSDYKK